jgi:predicted phage tail protein
MNQIRTIHLHGRLGKKYGRQHQLAVSTPAEAIRAINANHPGFADEILKLGEQGYAYRVLHGKRANIGLNSAEELNDPASGDIRIVPEIAGAKKGGLGQLIAGIAMIALVYFTGGAAAGLWGTSVAGTTVGSIAMNIGLSLALGGVVQMLASTTKSGQTSEKKTNPSYIFDGAINTMAQGHPVPIGYGEMIVGSAVISAGVDIDQVAIPQDPAETGPTWTNPATGNVEPYPPPTLAWDHNLNNWTLPDGTELLYDSTYGNEGHGAEGGNWIETRSNFRTPDGRVPVLTASPNRWDIPDATVFATAAKYEGQWAWFIRGGSVRIIYAPGDKRFQVVGGGDTSGGDGNEGTVGDDGSGVSAGDGNAGDGGTGGGDGSGSGGGTGTA